MPKSALERPRASTPLAPPAAELGSISGSLVLSATTERVKAVRRGLPASSVRRLENNLGVTRKELARAVNIPERTLAYRLKEKSGRLKTDESERVLRIALLLERAEAVLGGSAAARSWLSEPCRALGGEKPLDYAGTEPGAREVEALLGRLEHGVFT